MPTAGNISLASVFPGIESRRTCMEYAKNGIVDRSTVKSKEELKSKVVGGLRKIQKSPDMVKSFFQHEKTTYAA